jgi:uncharacterized membrane protein
MTDATGPTFTQVQAQTVWTNYISKVEGLCGALEHRQKADILAEIKAHLLESYIRLDVGDEESRISAAIAKLGQPEDFVPLWVEERLLEAVQPGSTTRNLYFLLRSNALKGVQQFLFSMIAGFGYLLSFYFFIMAALKIFFPENIGLYLSPSGIPFLGYVDADEFTEVLGYWLIPIGLISAIFLHYVITQMVRQWVLRFRQSNSEGE